MKCLSSTAEKLQLNTVRYFTKWCENLKYQHRKQFNKTYKMKFFLTLKHWQFFVFACVLPFFIELTSFINYTIGAIYVFPMMMLLFMFFFSGWFYAVGTNLYPKLPAKAKMSLTRFKIFLFFPIFYILAISVFLVVSMIPYSTSGGPIEPWIFLLILPLHLF